MERRNKKSRTSNADPFVESGALDEEVTLVENRLGSSPKSKKRKASPARSGDDDPKYFVKRRIAKYFGAEIFFGTIMKYEAPRKSGDLPLWYVLYDDGDQESLEVHEVEQLVALYERREICRKDKYRNG